MAQGQAIANLTLFHYPLSRSLRVLHLVEEVGWRVDVKRMQLMQGDGYKPEFLALNPNHAVPVVTFDVGGERVVMSESAAIVRVLALQARAEGKPKLMPAFGEDPLPVVADWERFFSFCTTTVDTVLWGLRVANDFKIGNDESVAYNAKKYATELAPQIEARLAQTQSQGGFASAWGFSVLDVVLMQLVNWASKYAKLGLVPPPGPATREYMKRVASRPAFRRATADASEFEKDGDASVIAKLAAGAAGSVSSSKM